MLSPHSVPLAPRSLPSAVLPIPPCGTPRQSGPLCGLNAAANEALRSSPCSQGVLAIHKVLVYELVELIATTL